MKTQKISFGRVRAGSWFARSRAISNEYKSACSEKHHLPHGWSVHQLEKLREKSVLRLSAITLALCFSANGAWAATTTVSGGNVTLLSGGNLTVSDANGDSVQTIKTQGSTGTLGKFNSSLGVLTGASAVLGMPANWTTSLTVSNNSGYAVVKSTWSLGGNNSGSRNLNSVGFTTSGGGSASDWGWDNLIFNNSANLNNFVGTGNIASNSFSTEIWAWGTASGGSATTATVNQNLVVSESIVYTYTAHSNASFTSSVDTNALSYDFGQISSGISADHGLSIFGLAGGLGLAGYTTNFISGDDVFTITGGSSIGVGGSGSYNAHFNAQSPGVQTLYSGTYRITFTDDVSGLGGTFASNSVGTNFIDIALVASVPEPETYAMLLAGLGLVGWAARQRKG